jgi:hypothetical protein
LKAKNEGNSVARAISTFIPLANNPSLKKDSNSKNKDDCNDYSYIKDLHRFFKKHFALSEDNYNFPPVTIIFPAFCQK